MHDELLASDSSATTPQTSEAGNAAAPSPAANQFSEAIKLLMNSAPEGSGDTPSSTATVASDGPSTEDALQAAGEVAAAQRRFFGLRRAMETAMRVLTKERSFLPVEVTPGVASTSIEEQYDEALPEEQPATMRPTGLSGHTSTVAMPEVLGFLAQLRKTGTLWIWNRYDHYRVQLVDGNVTFARSEARRQGSLLGEILVSQGAVDAARFEEFMAQERGPGPMGDALIAAGLVTREALTAAVQHQAQCVFDRAFGLEDAYFRFDGNPGTDTPESIRISVTQMLFESARERDESEHRGANVAGDPHQA